MKSAWEKNSQKARIIIRVTRGWVWHVTHDRDPRVTIFVTRCLFVYSAPRALALSAHTSYLTLLTILGVLKGSISYIETLPVWKQNILAARSFVTPTHSYLAVITNKVLHILHHRINFMTDFEWNEWWEPQQEIFWSNKYGWNVFYETLVIFLNTKFAKKERKTW